jgi:tetrapyrrole methylase family protein/MazG family protein
MLDALGIELSATGLQIIQAQHLARAHHPHLDPDCPALIIEFESAHSAAVQRVLLAQYPPEHELKLIEAQSDSSTSLATCHLPLAALTTRHATMLYIPPLPRASSFESFAEVIAHLRAPDGCPWDRAQTPQTLRRYLLEEAYEALEALDLNQPQRLKEELGDLLLQIVLQSQLASEAGEFKVTDVIAHIHAKMIRRHPHVFGDLQGATTEEIEANWEKIKRAEKSFEAEVTSFFKDIPKGLPALTESEDMQQRASRVGLWNGSDAESEARYQQTWQTWHAQHTSEALGDALFMLVDQARRAGLDAESALREANRKFERSLTQASPRTRSAAGPSLYPPLDSDHQNVHT